MPIISDERVIFHNYEEIVPEGVHFKAKFGQFPMANGRFVDIETDGDGPKAFQRYDFNYDAIRFSHKVFSIFGASRLYDCDELFWIDGDSHSHALIDDAFFESASPGDGHLSYLGRPNNYSECGFMVFNRRNPIHDTFLNQLASEYLNGDLFLQPQWHDCTIIDAVRDHFARTEGVANKNLSGEDAFDGHPWIHCFLESYMEHMKGPQRKKAAGVASNYNHEADRLQFWSRHE